jgi:hypothetical protein
MKIKSAMIANPPMIVEVMNKKKDLKAINA